MQRFNLTEPESIFNLQFFQKEPGAPHSRYFLAEKRQQHWTDRWFQGFSTHDAKYSLYSQLVFTGWLSHAITITVVRFSCISTCLADLPGPFYELCRDLWPGRYQPTIGHHFIRLHLGRRATGRKQPPDSETLCL